MTLLDTLKSYLPNRTPAPLAEPKKVPHRTSARHLAGKRARSTSSRRSRVSVDNAEDLPFMAALFIQPPPDADTAWRTSELDSATLSRMAPADLLELMVDVSPEVSRALFDFIRMFNPGWECNALRPSGKPDKRGQIALDGIITTLKKLYLSFDVTLGRLILGGFLRGAFLAEVVLDENGREFVDLATPDPYSVRFKKVKDPIRGNIWQMGQWQGSGFKILDSPTIAYAPIDPMPGQPYGRSLISPAIFTAIFLIGLLHDLRRVVAQQGYPRIDVEVRLEKLAASMPPDAVSNPEIWQQWVNEIIDEVKTVYASLEPDDAYVHADVVGINRPVGAIDSSSLGAVDGLIRALERMATRALKTMPLLMGSNEAVSESHANRQWEIHVAGIKSIQHLLESLLESLFAVALQAQGIQTIVEFRFSELRASEQLRDEQTRTMKYANLITAYNQGWIGQEECAEEAVGHEPDEDAPRRGSAPEPQIEPEQVDTQIPEESDNRSSVVLINANGHKVES